MATKVNQICVLVLWISCHVLFVKGSLFFHLRPLSPELCPFHASDEENVCYDIVSTNFNCSSVISNTCNDERKRRRLVKIEFSLGPCYRHVKTTCKDYLCQERCCDGYQRDANGKCISEADIKVQFCRNGGTPVGDKCICPQYYSGESCQYAVCEPECQNGGLCQAKNSYTKPICVCSSHFTGQACENAVCSTNCENGGLCVQNMTESVCLCKEGYTGSRCEIEIGSFQCEKCRLHDQYNTSCASYCNTNDDCTDEEYCCEHQDKNICVFRHEYFYQQCYLRDLSTVIVGTTFKNYDGELCRCVANKDRYSSRGKTICDNNQCPDGQALNCVDEDEDEQSVDQTLPPDYHKPIIENCPREGERVVAEVVSNSNVGFLIYKFRAIDWGGQGLDVKIHQEKFHACNCSSKIFHNKATTHPDKFGKTSSCCFTVELLDKIPPTFLSCPSPVFALDTEPIYWRKPEAIDNVGIRHMSLIPDVKNGSRLNPGSYIFQYKAEDWGGNIAVCKFYLNIVGRDTDENNWPEGLQKRMTKVDTSVIVGGCVVGILAILLMVLIVVIFRVCRTRAKRLRGIREHAARQRNQNEDPVFTVFSSDPPPYEVAVKDKLPEYTARDDPPKYEQYDSSA